MEQLFDLAFRAARDAGALLLERYGRPARGLGSKRTPTDLVSDADRDSETLIVKLIRSERPKDAILGEESGRAGGSTGLTWVIDPLDGTQNFLHGIPQWCVSIAVEDDAGGLVAVILDPVRAEAFTARRGHGAHVNGRRLHGSSVERIEEALVATGFSYLPDERERWGRVVAAMLPRVADVRRAGSAALDLAWTAAGRVDAYAEVPVARWDRAAGTLIAQEAGCLTTPIPAIGASGSGIVAAPTALHHHLLKVLQECGLTL
jgi:myo-inositol-1(or 4)-monophosphatase